MEVDGDVRDARIVSGWLDVADRAERREIRNVLRDVGPRLAAVARDVKQAVVRACPDESCLLRRLRDRKDDVAVLDADVVGRESAGTLLMALVVGRQIRADFLPALAA